MKTSSLVLLSGVAALLGPVTALAAEDLPKPMGFARYNPMLDHSPFAVATAIAPPVVAPNFAKDLYVSNAAHSPGGDLVTIQSTSDRNLNEYLTSKGPNEHGYGIANIEWSERVGATKVTISKDGQFATLGFNEALATQPLPHVPVQPTVVKGMIPQNMVPQPAIPQSVVPQTNQQKFPQAEAAPVAPSYPTPVPRVRGPIKRHVESMSAVQAMEPIQEKPEKK